jgi:hypothetical protein
MKKQFVAVLVVLALSACAGVGSQSTSVVPDLNAPASPNESGRAGAPQYQASPVGK